MKRPEIMAILNITPDSFSDGGNFFSAEAALAQAKKYVVQGADIIDIGAESTRPGSEAITWQEEQRRLAPVFAALKQHITIPLSIDTYKAVIAEWALERGARFVNDVWGLQRDLDMAATVARHHAKIIIMHNRFDGVDGSVNILSDMDKWFETSLGLASRYGIADDKITLDPGIGFGKTFEQNLTVLANLDRIKKFGYPVLMGLSRKRFLGAILKAEVDDRLYGTLAANLHCLLDGVSIIRVHDVKPHRDVIDVIMAIDAARGSVQSSAPMLLG